MLISDAYREQNAVLHQTVPAYGVGGAKWASLVRSITGEFDTILDYGCGKGTLAKALFPRPVMEYDPAIPGKDSADIADTVVCTDVLEHIEPDQLDNVLAHLHDMTRKRLLVCISTVLAKKTLPDGRNAHLSVWPASWWKEKLSQHFTIDRWEASAHSVTGIVRPIRELGAITSIPAMEEDVRNEHVRRNIKAVSSRLQDNVAPHDRLASLACFAPSLRATFRFLTGDIYCVGAAHSFLIENDIIPVASIDCDPRSRVADQLGKPHKDVKYWLASCINPAYIQKLQGFDVSLFHLHNGEVSANFIWDHEPDAWLLNGGGSVGLRAISLLYAQGYRRFEIHGMDSSYEEDREYAGAHTGPEKKNIFSVKCRDRWFRSNAQLVDYARQFITDRPLLWPDAEIRLHGDGLLQEMCRA